MIEAMQAKAFDKTAGILGFARAQELRKASVTVEPCRNVPLTDKSHVFVVVNEECLTLNHGQRTLKTALHGAVVDMLALAREIEKQLGHLVAESKETEVVQSNPDVPAGSAAVLETSVT